MPYTIDMNYFWSNSGVVSGATPQTYDQYTTFSGGLLMGDGSIIYSMKEWYEYNNHSRFSFWSQWNTISNGDVPYEFIAYENTNDPNIYDFYTFWKYAGAYIGTNIPSPPAYNIMATGFQNLTCGFSNDSGDTFSTSVIQIPSVLPSGVFAPAQMNSKALAGTKAYFGSTHAAGKTYIYKYDIPTQSYTLQYTFSAVANKSADAMIWVNDNLFYSFTTTNTFNKQTSINGLTTFTQSTISPSFFPQKAAYSPSLNRMVLGGRRSPSVNTTRFLYSTDIGSTWSVCSSHTSFAQDIVSVEWIDNIGLFVAVVGNTLASPSYTAIYTSGDGDHWTEAYFSTQPATKEDYICQAYNPQTNIWMCMSDNADFGLVSYDGCVSFTTIAPPKVNYSQLVCVPDINRFIAFDKNAGTDGVYYTDSDGLGWNQPTSPDVNGWQNVIVY